MTSKELMYVEDALGHEKYLGTQCCDTISKLQDGELQRFAAELNERHKAIFATLYNLL